MCYFYGMNGKGKYSYFYATDEYMVRNYYDFCKSYTSQKNFLEKSEMKYLLKYKRRQKNEIFNGRHEMFALE